MKKCRQSAILDFFKIPKRHASSNCLSGLAQFDIYINKYPKSYDITFLYVMCTISNLLFTKVILLCIFNFWGVTENGTTVIHMVFYIYIYFLLD